MDYIEIIKQLIDLEQHFEQGRKKTYELRAQIEQIDSPRVLSDEEVEEAKLAKLLSKKINGASFDKNDITKRNGDGNEIAAVK